MAFDAEDFSAATSTLTNLSRKSSIFDRNIRDSSVCYCSPLTSVPKFFGTSIEIPHILPNFFGDRSLFCFLLPKIIPKAAGLPAAFFIITVIPVHSLQKSASIPWEPQLLCSVHPHKPYRYEPPSTPHLPEGRLYDS